MIYRDANIFIAMDGSVNRNNLLYVKCSDKWIRDLIFLVACFVSGKEAHALCTPCQLALGNVLFHSQLS